MAFTMVPRPTPAGRRAGIDFLPETKGDLDAALASRHAMERIAPRSPRPVDLIEKVRVVGEVTGADMALWELCVSVAKERGLDAEQHRIPVTDALRFLGKAARRPALMKSLRRLRKAALDFDLVSDEQVREFGEVPMLVAHFAHREDTGDADLLFTVPEPVRRLLLRPSRFAYIEPGALPHMRSRYTVSLYQRLALRAGATYKDNRPGEIGDIAGYVWEIAPKALAEELGWRRSGDWHYGVFRREVLQPALRDLAAVRSFSTELEEIRARTRGRPVELLRFRLCPLPPDWRELRTPKADERILLELSRPDRRDLSVPAKLWLRAGA